MTASQKRLEGSPYVDDDGSADPALAAALAAQAAARGDGGSRATVLAALQRARVLVPVVAVLGEVEVDPADGLARDKSADMAAVLLQGADGRMALLAFTDTTALARWNPEARPVPASVRTAAQAAVQEDAAALVLDVAGPSSFVVEGDDLRALAAGWTLARVGDDLAWIAGA